MGYTFMPTMLKDNNAAHAIETACSTADIQCITVNEEFRKRAAEEDLFDTYDSHFNAQGGMQYMLILLLQE